MKQQPILITAVISLVALLYILYLNNSQQEGFVTVHDFTDMTSDAMHESRAHLSEIATLIQHIGKPILPPSERKVWKCNKNTGYVYQDALNCANEDCMTAEESKKNCRYKPLPSSHWNIADQYTRESEDEKLKRLENDVNRLNLRHANVYIPPATNTCKLGCTFTPNISNLDPQSNNLWKCNPHEIINSQHGLSNDYYNQDLCREDTDCMWCNRVGVEPINIQTQAEREKDEPK
jgi:hypothetical protein